MNRDRIAHNLANKILRLASEQYRFNLRAVIEVGKEALKHEDICDELLDRMEARRVR